MAKQAISNWADRYKHISFWWATVGGSGLLRPAPGTWGSLVGLITGYLLIQNNISVEAFSLLIAIYSAVSSWMIDQIEKQSGIHDAPEIVADEVAGQWLALLPCFFWPTNFLAYSIAFAAFRLFDIWKPWPIGPLDKHVQGGFGVMIDDIIAGIFAAGLVTIALMAGL